jgi:hypothetical protein
MADDPNDPIDITEILELKKINEELRKAGIRPATTQEHQDAKARAKAIEFEDPKSKGELVPFGEEQPPKRGGLWPLLRQVGRRIHPALGLADLAVKHMPSEEKIQERIKEVEKESPWPTLRKDPVGHVRSGLETIVDLVKGKNPSISRRDFMKGVKTAGQMAVTPNLPLELDPKTVEAGITINEGLPTAAADKLFKLWKKPSEKIMRNIYFTADTRKKPGAVSIDEIQDFREHWKEGIASQIGPDEEVVVKDASGPGQEIGEVYNKPRLIPDYDQEWDNSRGTSVFDYEDPPTKEELDTFGKGTWSRYEALIDLVYSDKKTIEWQYKIDTLLDQYTRKENYKDTYFMNDSDKEFVKFIKSMKNQGVTRDEIYDLWQLGAKRYLDNYLDETTGFFDIDDDYTKQSGGVIRNPYSYAPRDI